MARPDIQYIQFYTAGSAAREIVQPLRKESTPGSRPKKAKARILYIDPVAIFGMVTALVLMVCLAVAVSNYNTAREDYAAAQEYNVAMQQKNADLQQRYTKSFDREQMRMEAVLRGYVPSSQVEHRTVNAVQPVSEPAQPSAWESFWDGFAELFA